MITVQLYLYPPSGPHRACNWITLPLPLFYIYVMYYVFGRADSFHVRDRKKKCKIEKFFFLWTQVFCADWGKVSLLNCSIESFLFSSWGHSCSVGAFLATTSVDDHCKRFEVLVALGAKIVVFLGVLLLSLISHNEGFRGTCAIYLPFSKMVCTKWQHFYLQIVLDHCSTL